MNALLLVDAERVGGELEIHRGHGPSITFSLFGLYYPVQVF
jgi:hypothetical protein